MFLLMNRRNAASSLIVISLTLRCAFLSCSRSTDKDCVVVRVFRDANADFSRDLDRALYTFGGMHRTESGKVIMVATMESSDYRKLAEKIAVGKPQLIILDSPADVTLLNVVDLDLRQAKSACGRNKDCPAFIPPWVSGEELEATKQVFSAIAGE
jgi:hypothetical protein